MFLLFEFVCGTPPSLFMLKSWGVVVVAYSILVSAPVPLVLDLIGTLLGLGLGLGFGTKGLGKGLDNTSSANAASCTSKSKRGLSNFSKASFLGASTVTEVSLIWDDAFTEAARRTPENIDSDGDLTRSPATSPRVPSEGAWPQKPSGSGGSVVSSITSSPTFSLAMSLTSASSSSAPFTLETLILEAAASKGLGRRGSSWTLLSMSRLSIAPWTASAAP